MVGVGQRLGERKKKEKNLRGWGRRLLPVR
jgi:hypothetical protein